ncbi:MAG: prepilin-type N-terminal cleavage/methylation domain-containing protein [bacterium]|nr:prepilin-type N-terminal cleavage/methylation domain-containing protein [bacterium]
MKKLQGLPALPAGRQAVRQGFTLIEAVIAIGIFGMVMLTVTTLFIQLNSTRRVNQSQIDILNELRFGVDLMGQEILSGYAFPNTCDSGCNPVASAPFVFASQVRPDVPTKRIEYYLDTSTGRIMRGELRTFGPCTSIPLSEIPGCFAPITSAKAQISQLTYTVKNKGTSLQPVVNITMSGTIQGEDFQLSSSYSPRIKQDPSASPPTDVINPTINITIPTSQPTYNTSVSSVSLGGNAEDNVGVASVSWANQTTGETGTAMTSGSDPSITWSATSIRLYGGADNIIIVTASDAEGNIGTAQITVTSAAQPPVPSINASQDCSGSGPGIWVSWPQNPSFTQYHIYRCSGNCTPDMSDEIGVTTCVYPANTGNNFWDDGVNSYPWQCDGAASWYSGRLISYTTTPPDATDSKGGPTGSTWSYRVKGENFIGNLSPFSNTVTQTQPAPYCGSPPAPTPTPTPCSGSCPTPTPTPTPAGSFNLTASPQLVLAGVTGDAGTSSDSETATITVNNAGYGGSVSFSCQGDVPSGSICHFNPSSVTPTGSSVFYITVPGNTVKRDYSISVVGSGGGLSSSVIVILRVLAKGTGGQ